MHPPFACIPVCTLFTSLGLLFAVVALFGIYNRDETAPDAPAALPDAHAPHWWVIVLIVIVGQLFVLSLMWLLPDW